MAPRHIHHLHLHIRNVARTVDPLRLLESLASQPGDMAMLHSGPGGDAVLAIQPIARAVLEAQGDKIACRGSGLPGVLVAEKYVAENATEAWKWWREFLTGASFSQPAPEFIGWLGWISYEAGVIAELPQLYNNETHDIPLAHWQLFERYFLFDSTSRQWRLVTLGVDAMAATHSADLMEAQLAAVGEKPCGKDMYPMSSEVLLQPDAQQFKAAVRHCLEYIVAGDIYQANLSSLYNIRITQSGHHIFARLMEHNPAQYAAFMRYGAHDIISASPELFLQRKGGWLETRPIKGTSPRKTDDPVVDNHFREDLLHSEKDRAELAMIVDLLRNDLGRVCSKVCVLQARKIEKLPTLWHTHGIISGELSDPASFGWDRIILTMCPGGSISGVPKIRAMQIIHSLETSPRGIYCGNIGWISPAGDGTLNIAIRTIHLYNGIAHFRSGAGITAGSNPEEEYAEVLAKAAALQRGLMNSH